MPNLPINFNWWKSPVHLRLLSSFEKPRDTQRVISWQFYKQELKEDPAIAIDRLVRDGALIPASVEESLECIFQVAQLKRLLKERGFKVSGSKSDLVERLVSADLMDMDKIVQKYKVLKCSLPALELLLTYEEKRQQALSVAKNQSFEALKNSKPKDAYKINIAYQRAFNNPGIESYPYLVEDMQHILASQPKILVGISPENLKFLRAATCMQILWQDEVPEAWLPATFSSGLKNNRIAINYLAIHARIKGSLENYDFATRVKVVFQPGDIDSCELCQSLNGKVFDIDKVPELPMIGCTSDTGCKCHIESAYDISQDEDALALNIEHDYSEVEVDPVDKLRKLKQMLDEELITREEYEKKKGEILSRF